MNKIRSNKTNLLMMNFYLKGNFPLVIEKLPNEISEELFRRFEEEDINYDPYDPENYIEVFFDVFEALIKQHMKIFVDDSNVFRSSVVHGFFDMISDKKLQKIKDVSYELFEMHFSVN